jgi:hypothetical protein
MAYQGYRSKTDKTVGENEASPTKVAGRPDLKYRDGGENRTPAPVREVSITETARSTSWGRSMGDAGDNSGKQGYGGPSSVNPGERTGPATVNPCAPVDAVKDAILAGGAKATQRSDDWQTRNSDYTSEQADPTAWGNRSRAMDDGSPGSVIPKKNG